MIRDYKYLQGRIDELIKMYGSEKAATFIEIFIDSKDFDLSVSNFITMCTTSFYGITVDSLKEEGRLNASARKICYKLHKDFLKYSIRKTGRVYDRKENAVMMGIRSMEEVIKSPRSDQELYLEYISVESQVKRFVAFLNKDSEK